MACTPIIDIPEADCGSNAGGNLKLYAVPVSEVTSVPAPGASSMTIGTDITLDILSGGWREIGHIGETAKWTSTRQGDVNSGSYLHSAMFNASKYDNGKAYALSLLEGQKLLLLVEDANGTVVLLGSLKRPMMLSKNDFDTGQKATDIAQFIVEFKGKYPFLTHPYIYTGTIV